MTPALARRISRAVALLGSPQDGEALAAARAIGRMLEATGMAWPAFAAMVEAEATRTTSPAFTFAALHWRTARKQMGFLAFRPGVARLERTQLEALRARLLAAKKLALADEEIAWLDKLWRVANGCER